MCHSGVINIQNETHFILKTTFRNIPEDKKSMLGLGLISLNFCYKQIPYFLYYYYSQDVQVQVDEKYSVF